MKAWIGLMYLGIVTFGVSFIAFVTAQSAEIEATTMTIGIGAIVSTASFAVSAVMLLRDKAPPLKMEACNDSDR